MGVQPNQLILAMQPNEGVSLSLGAKIPGARMRIRPVNMEFLYGTSFLSQSPEAYERLILDAMRGDATLFTRNDEVEAPWRIIDPILEAWETDERPLPSTSRGLARPGGGRRATRARPPLAGHLGWRRRWCRRSPTWAPSGPRRTRRPATIEAALRELLTQRTRATTRYAPARVLNLIAIVDRDWRGEIMNRLEQVGRYHASRTILCAVEPGRTTLDASVVMTIEGERQAGRLAAHARARDRGRGPAAPARLDTIVDPLIVPDLRRSCGRRTGTTRPSTRCSTWRRSC